MQKGVGLNQNFHLNRCLHAMGTASGLLFRLGTGDNVVKGVGQDRHS